MNNLENQLGCKLFVRSNRGVTLTAEGEKLYQHVSVAYQHLHAAEAELAMERSMESGSITISASEIALHLLLLPILGRFHKQYPGVRLRLLNHSTPEAVESVKNGLADFAVVTTPLQAKKPLKSTSLMSFKEIADITGVSINTALGRMRYALLNLRKMAVKKELHLAIS